MAFIVSWPQNFNSWHREGLNSFGEPHAAEVGFKKMTQAVTIPPKPVVSGGVTYIVGTMVSVRPSPR
jgi:hypothetical protein